MKTTVYTAALAATGLLVLSACVHGSGDDTARPATDEVDDLRGASSTQFLDATAQPEISMPQLESGGVAQSAAVDVAGVSGVSTTFDGTDVTITISRDDGSALSLSSLSDTLDASGSAESPIAGHGARSWVLYKFDNDGMSVAIATVTADASNAADYLTVGHWAHVAGDLTDPSDTGAEFGAFVDGPELSQASPANVPVHGEASYAGPVSGAYAILHGTDAGVTPGSTESGLFSSTVKLTADFAANTIGGCIGCSETVTLSGTLVDADSGESSDVLFEDSGYRLDLHSTSLNSDGTFEPGQMRLRHPVISITGTEGTWGGRFSNIADSDGDPRLVAGTFGAEAASAGGSEGTFVGSFVGAKE